MASFNVLSRATLLVSTYQQLWEKVLTDSRKCSWWKRYNLNLYASRDEDARRNVTRSRAGGVTVATVTLGETLACLLTTHAVALCLLSGFAPAEHMSRLVHFIRQFSVVRATAWSIHIRGAVAIKTIVPASSSTTV